MMSTSKPMQVARIASDLRTGTARRRRDPRRRSGRRAARILREAIGVAGARVAATRRAGRRCEQREHDDPPARHCAQYSVVVDLARMLDKCIRDQWRVDDVDWSVPPAPMARDKEEAVVQYFTDMAGIERLAGALFETRSAAKTADPTAREDLLDVRRRREAPRRGRRAPRRSTTTSIGYRAYAESPELTRVPAALPAPRRADTSPELANAYITAGELILDVALLRSVDDYVADCDEPRGRWQLVNRDESRHIAVDFHG